MSRSSIERKLNATSQQLGALRDELTVIDEQLRHFVDTEDDTYLRSLVSESPEAGGEHREATKAVAGIRRDREARMKKIAKLELKLDTLLDQLVKARS